MKVQDLADPQANILGGSETMIWGVMFGALIIVALVLAYMNKDSLGKEWYRLNLLSNSFIKHKIYLAF